jgi:hypothetical protein
VNHIFLVSCVIDAKFFSIFYIVNCITVLDPIDSSAE